MRSGVIYTTNTAGTFRHAGINGHWWVSRATTYNSSTSALAYEFHFGATDVYTSGGPYTRYSGYPLRCLSTVLDI